MKFLILLSVIFCSLTFGSLAFAKNHDCQVLRVFYTNYFEEGLSKKEYPELTLTFDDADFELTIGAAAFASSEGDSITALPKVGFRESYRVVSQDKNYVMVLNFDSVISRKKGYLFTRGTLFGQVVFAEGESPRTVKIATFRCK